MDGSSNYLTQRADGLVETKNGDLAITMIVSTNDLPEGKRYFEFALTNFENSRLEWNVEDMLQIFPNDVAILMIRRHWAIVPTQISIDWYEDRMAQLEAEAKAAADLSAKVAAEEEAAKIESEKAEMAAKAEADAAALKEAADAAALKEAADAAAKAVEAAKAPQEMAKEPAPADAPEAGTKEEEKTTSEATAAPAVAPAPDAEATAATTSATKKAAK